MLKYSLGTLFVVTAFASLASAAVANYSLVWAEVMVTVTAAMLLLGLLAAILARGNARTFAIGFAVAGWVYFALTFIDAVGVRGRLLTSRAINRLYALTQDSHAGTTMLGYSLQGSSTDTGMMGSSEMMSSASVSGFMFGASSSGMTGVLVLSEAPRELHDIGHCIWTLVLALLGGLSAQAIQKMGRSREA